MTGYNIRGLLHKHTALGLPLHGNIPKFLYSRGFILRSKTVTPEERERFEMELDDMMVIIEDQTPEKEAHLKTFHIVEYEEGLDD